MSRLSFEPGTAAQFELRLADVVGSPALVVEDTTGAVVSSATLLSSGSWYGAVLGVPETEGAYVAEWNATITRANSTYPFVRRFAFNVARTRAS